jgi:hypothetical protein
MKKPTEAKTALTRPSAKETARENSDLSLKKIQNALKAAQAELKRERQARIQAEKALIEARKELAAIRLELEQDHQIQIRRVSFVVRLISDKHGKLGRTEIEHVSSSRKRNFLRLDGEQLVAFMKACISPVIMREETSSAKSPPK